MPHQLQTPKVGAIVDHDRVLKVHQGLEFSSADSYLYPQKSRAVRSGELASLSYYNEVSYVRSNLTAREFAVSNEVTLHREQVRHSGSAVLIQGDGSLCTEIASEPTWEAQKFPGSTPTHLPNCLFVLHRNSHKRSVPRCALASAVSWLRHSAWQSSLNFTVY